MSQLRRFLESNGFYRISLKKLITVHYKFSAKINGFDGEFILDTGASSSCIGFSNAASFSLKIENSNLKAAGAGATNMDTKISKRNLVIMGNLKTRNMDFVLFDLSHVNDALTQANEEVVQGIIGADFLKRRKAVIDYGRNALYVK